MRFQIALFLALLPLSASAATLEVGDGKKYPTIESALAAAKQGDEILIFPLKNNQPYPKTAALIRTPRLTLRAADPKAFIPIDGAGFNYSGRGSTPRAIFQFDPAADSCTLEGFDLSNAHNESFNGAAVRINAANNITIRRCNIHDNDMGIMSNGQLKQNSAANQLITGCLIRRNGTDKQPGYNHNLYLGGTSVTVSACEIADSLTGHNLKSRAHQNWIEYNFIHDSANREIDLVDEAGNTDQPDSDTVLLGNIIRKAPNMAGNKTVIHFGKDGNADHTGTLFLFHNTITSTYISPIIDLSAPGASACLFNNDIRDIAGNAVLISDRNNSVPTGGGNVFSRTFDSKSTASLAGPLVPWDELTVPWKTFARTPEPFQKFQKVNAIVPAPATRPGA